MIVGIDLAGSEKRNTGLCYLNNNYAICKIARSDKEIIRFVELVRPKIIAIDAPLSLPKGRRSINQKRGPHFRKCDLELRRMGIKFFPITLGPMRKLTERGLRLKAVLEKKYTVVEVFPGATQDIMGISRKNNLLELRRGLEKAGIQLPARQLSHDELDAVTCALTAKLWIEGRGMFIGDPKEGLMLIPKPI